MENTRQTFRYDVFLSFRGFDTRYNFTSHLYEALKRHNVEVFHDTSLPRGQGIGSQLFEAIKESKIFVVVFSINYADSKWCLNELYQMLHCLHMNDKQTILPVYLYCKPSDVSASLNNLITNPEKKFDQETVQKWREALEEAGQLSGGLHLQDDADGNEHELIEQIVKKIRKILHGQNGADLRHVGIESRVQEVLTLLNPDFSDDDDVRVVVICGPAGIGKTTVAKATYERLVLDFEAQDSCFLSDVKTIFGEANGKLTLQKTLISNLVLNDESRNPIGSYDQGIRKLQRMIKSRKLLLVLDDVDDEEQLRILCTNRAFLRGGSRIIVTTRDKSKAVDWVKPNAMYEPRLLDETESLKVFCLYAFGQDHPKEGYEDVSKEAVCCGAGCPGVLKNLAVYMGRYQSVEQWRCALRYVIHNPSCITDEAFL